MCYFPGRPAAGNGRQEIQRSIWDNQSGQKALSKIRELQRGVPPPYGEQFSKETLIRSASSKAFAATTEARIGPNSDPLRDGFQATSLDSDEVQQGLNWMYRSLVIYSRGAEAHTSSHTMTQLSSPSWGWGK
ncbi:hypothetical protein WJX77_007443 [Trebouxia sp. C0004]